MIWIVAVCKDSQDRVAGYRIYDTESKAYMDAAENSVRAALLNGQEIANAALDDNGYIVGTRGNLKNYTIIKCGIILGKAKLVVIEELVDDMNTMFNVIAVASTEVKEVRMSLKTLMSYNNYDNQSALANASIVTNANGTVFVRGIGGEIKKTQIRDIDSLSSRARNIAALTDMPWEIDSNNQFKIRDKNKFNSDERNKILKIPDNVCYIGDDGCACTIIEKLITGTNLSVIGNRAFYGCTNLNHVELKNGLKVIKSLAFRNCNKLKEIEIPSSVIEIESGAFGGPLSRLILNNRRTVVRPNAVQRGTRILYK